MTSFKHSDINVVHFKITWFKFLCTKYGQNPYFVLQTFNILTPDTSLKFYMLSLSAMNSRRNGTEVEGLVTI